MRATISSGIGSLLSVMASHVRRSTSSGADAPYPLSPASTQASVQILVKSAKIIPRPEISRPGRSPGARKPGCRVASTRGGLAMPIHSPTVFTPQHPAAQLDRLGDEIAELSAHLDA